MKKCISIDNLFRAELEIKRTWVSVDLKIKFGKEQLTQIEEPNIDITTKQRLVKAFFPQERWHKNLLMIFSINSAESGLLVL